MDIAQPIELGADIRHDPLALRRLFRSGGYAGRTSGLRFGLIVHHTDGAREYSYDRKSTFGKLDKGLDAASANGWTVVSMKDDWKRVFGFQ